MCGVCVCGERVSVVCVDVVWMREGRKRAAWVWAAWGVGVGAVGLVLVHTWHGALVHALARMCGFGRRAVGVGALGRMLVHMAIPALAD